MSGELGYLLVLMLIVVCYIDTQVLQPRRDRLRLEAQRAQMLERILEQIKAARDLK